MLGGVGEALHAYDLLTATRSGDFQINQCEKNPFCSRS